MTLQRRNHTISSSIALLGLALVCAHTSFASESVVSAVNANNVTALESLSKSAPTASQRTLAVGALLALRREDSKAIAKLMPLARSRAKRAVRATAYLVLSEVYLRDQRFSACYSAAHTALELSPASVNRASRQAMEFARAISGVKPMQMVRDAPGSLPITDEMAGLVRVPIKIDGHQGGALLDTGASFSTISASVATHFGIKLLSHQAKVGSSTRRDVGVQLGIAKRLQIGNAMLKNAVFIVVPDSALPIPPRLKISAVIGLPVLMTLGRIEFLDSGTPTFRYDVPHSNPAGHYDIHSNLVLSALTPLVLVHVPGSGALLRMVLDTGANMTNFTKNAMTVAPTFFAGAKPYVLHFGGVGGSVREHRALRLPEATLIIGRHHIVLKNVIVSSRSSATRDGVIGANILRAGKRLTIDFKAMRVSVSN